MLDAEGGAGPRELGIMYSHTCNIACRHCGILSGPRNHATMPAELARRCIREASEVPGIQTIAFTGGEPFVFVKELDRLIGLAYDHGFSTRVVTNGFWGRNPRRARSLLMRLQLAGLDTINFSADKYHLEFMCADTLKAAVGVARELGYVIVVNFTTNTQEDPADAFARLYDWPREELRPFGDQSDFVAMALSEPELLYSKVHLSHGRLIGLGRAAEHPEEHLLSPRSDFPYGRCGEVINRPVVYPNGDLQACCCAGGKIAAFTVGNLAREKLSTLVARMRHRSHFRFIGAFGPRRLHEAMCGEDDQHHASICDLCVAASSNFSASEIDDITERWVLGHLLRA